MLEFSINVKKKKKKERHSRQQLSFCHRETMEKNTKLQQQKKKSKK